MEHGRLQTCKLWRVFFGLTTGGIEVKNSSRAKLNIIRMEKTFKVLTRQDKNKIKIIIIMYTPPTPAPPPSLVMCIAISYSSTVEKCYLLFHGHSLSFSLKINQGVNWSDTHTQHNRNNKRMKQLWNRTRWILCFWFRQLEKGRIRQMVSSIPRRRYLF